MASQTESQNHRLKSETIVAEIDSLFHQAEKSNPDQEVTYLDVVRIISFVRERFDHVVPPDVDSALQIAEGLCHPKKLEAISLLRKGLGGLLGIAGLTSLGWGILYGLAHGIVATTIAGSLWWKTSVVSILFGGPVGVAVGIASLGLGIYVASRKVSPKRRAVAAMDVMRRAIRSWGAHIGQPEMSAPIWIVDLSDAEYTALLNLIWYLIHADDKVAEQETQFVVAILRQRRPIDDRLATGIATLDHIEAIGVLRNCVHRQQVIAMLKSIPAIDGESTQSELSACNELCDELGK